MKFAPHVLGLAIACVAMPALAKPAYVASTLNLRAAPGTGSEIVAKIPGGSLVDTGACDEGWCEISWQDKKGFGAEFLLQPENYAGADQHRRKSDHAIPRQCGGLAFAVVILPAHV